MYRETMEQSWLSSTIDYVCNTVSGDERHRSRTSDYQKVFSNGVWINDLPTSVYEPLETSCFGAHATPQQYEKELSEKEKKIAALKAECAAKNKEIAYLKDKLDDLEASSHKTDSNARNKPNETQHELKKAKRTAFVARANLIKKNLELDHLKNKLESAKERERQWKDSNDFLKSQISELQKELADFKKDVLGEIKRHQQPTNFAELDSFKEQERQWKESNDYLKFEISELRQQLQDFKTHVFNEIKRCQQPASFAEEASFKACPPLPPPPGEIQHSNLPLPSQSSNGDGIRKDNPYSLRAARAKRGVLNTRPLPPSIGVVQSPTGYGQLMNKPYSQVDEFYQPSPIWNPYAGSQTANGHLNSRPLPRNDAPGYTSHHGMNYLKGEKPGFFTRTFNNWFGF